MTLKELAAGIIEYNDVGFNGAYLTDEQAELMAKRVIKNLLDDSLFAMELNKAAQQLKIEFCGNCEYYGKGGLKNKCYECWIADMSDEEFKELQKSLADSKLKKDNNNE